MNIVILLCFAIFIIYFAICGILAYYFIKHRNIWNKTFPFIDSFNIFDSVDNFECPIHRLLWIPNLITENTKDSVKDSAIDSIKDCAICKEEENNNKIYLQELQTLSSVYKLFKEIDKKCIPQNTRKENKHNLQETWNMFIWLLEGSIKDYEMIKDEHPDVYYKLKETYETTVFQPSSNSLKENHSSNTENILSLSLENISYLENNIELCTKIITILKNNVFGENGFRENEFCEIKSNYLFALFYDIDEYIRQINLLFNKIFY
jgi:hypothetical protein